jgi:hypothetical protein
MAAFCRRNEEKDLMPQDSWVLADFNGLLEHRLLCLAHQDTVSDQAGHPIQLRPGLTLTAFDYDSDDDGRPDALLATGVVEPSPDYAQGRGSLWALRIDANGIRHESDVANGSWPR